MSRQTHIAGQFNGFPHEAFDFFELARNNNRDWFHAHQEVYERACREPMKQLVAELGANPVSTKLSRINRDMRFSRDKLPYHTYIAVGVHGNYISLSAAGLYVGAGLYKPEPAAWVPRRPSSHRAATHEGHFRRQDVCARGVVINSASGPAHQAGRERRQTSC